MVSVEEFCNPPARYRIKPFWFWNGELTREEITHQIEEMAKKGLGGMYICARQGMTVPYMSKEWLELVDYACGEAKRCGLEAWLYDEYPYPSGMSGGEVLLEHPEAEHKILRHKTRTVQGGALIREELGWSRVLYARAFRVAADGGTDWNDFVDIRDCVGTLQTEKIYQQTGLTKYNNKRFFSYGPEKILETDLPEGTWRLEIYLEEALGDFKYYGGFFDPCSREAVKTFLETTHDKYYRTNGDAFGKTVFGMFSDEVGLLSPIPWSPELPKAFLKRNGYSILDCLPALYDDTVENAVRIRYDFYETAHELFRDSYHKQVSDWCREHRLLYATEVPSMRHSTQRYSDVVGGDTAHEKLGKPLEWIYDEYIRNYRSNAKAVSSLARQLDKPYAMIESFHSVGWTMTLQDAKWMIDRLGSSGINLYNFHAFYYTIQDITKHDAPPSQFLQNPYWKHYRKLSDYVGRMGVLVSNTEADIHIAVLDPAAALWTKLGNPFNGFPYCGESEPERADCDALREGWVGVCKELLFHQLDYDHLDAEILAEAEVKDGTIVMGRASYSVVVLPECHCMEASARRKLEEFTRQGGQVVAVGMLPTVSIDWEESDAETAAFWEALFESGNAIRLDGGLENLADACCTKTCGAVRVCVTEGNPKDVIAVTRLESGAAEAACYVFLANQGGDPVRALLQTAEFRTSAAEQYNLESGEVTPIGRFGADGLTVDLEGYESRWIKIREEADGTVEENRGQGEAVTVLTVPMQGLWDCRPEGGNICRFDRPEISLDGKEWKPVEVKTFIEQCDETRLLGKEQIRMTGAFGTPKKIRPAYPLTCQYQSDFQIEKLPERIALFMDRETVSGAYEIRINGQALAPDWEPVRLNDQNNRMADIRSFVKTGENRILIQVTMQKDEDGLRDPFYLWGDFGVAGTGEKIPVKLTAQPEKACPDGAFPDGFPYYSGTMEYEKTFELEELASEPLPGISKTFTLRLGMERPCYECVEVLINGGSLGVKAYAPYVWIGKQEWLAEGENRVTVRITNTLANMLDGTYFDYDAHRLVPVKP